MKYQQNIKEIEPKIDGKLLILWLFMYRNIKIPDRYICNIIKRLIDKINGKRKYKKFNGQNTAEDINPIKSVPEKMYGHHKGRYPARNES